MGNYASVVLNDKPIRYYRLSELSGTTALDQLSSANNGTINGGVTLNQTGLLTADTDPSMLFNGSTGYISLPSSGLPTGANPWSLECWFQVPGSQASDFGTLMQVGTNNTNHTAILYYHSSSSSLELWDWSARVCKTATSFTITGSTYHIVGTYDGTTASLYVNGSVAQTAAHAYSLSYGNVFLGKDDNNNWLAGVLDEVAIYNVALSASKITNHYLAGLGAFNFPVVPITTATRDGHMTVVTRDGLSLTAKTRG